MATQIARYTIVVDWSSVPNTSHENLSRWIIMIVAVTMLTSTLTALVRHKNEANWPRWRKYPM